MSNKIPDHLINPGNQLVLDYLDGRSSHGDLTEVFLQTIKGLDEAKNYCPNDRPYAYYFAYAGSSIFGFCRSMRSLSFHLPENLHANAREDGGVPSEALEGSGWFDFPAFDTGDKSNHAAWAEAAYLNALRQG